MKKTEFLVYSAMFLLLGCSNVKDFQNPKKVHFSNKYLKEICCIGTEGFFELQDNKPVNIQNAISKMKQYRNFNCSYNPAEDIWECSAQDQTDGSFKTYCKCKWLGKWHDQDLIFRYYDGGGTGRFTGIFLCTVKNGNLVIKKWLLDGDRAMDGIISTPIFDGKNSIYFYCSLSTDTVAKLQGIKGKYPSQYAIGYWNISKCVYNLETDELEILDLLITQKNNLSGFFKVTPVSNF